MFKGFSARKLPVFCFFWFCHAAFAQQTLLVEAGPIENALDAPQKCERARVNWRIENQNSTDVRWTGNWEERDEGKRAVCEISYIEQVAATRTVRVDAGMIASNDEAPARCEAAGEAWLRQNSTVKRFRWTGQWHSTADNASATCEFRYIDPDTPTGQTEVETVAITDEADAALKCEGARQRWQQRQPDVQTSRWSGEWNQTAEGRFVCMVDYMTIDGRPLQSHDVQLSSRKTN